MKQGLDNFMNDYLNTDEGRSKYRQKQEEIHRLTVALNQAAKHNKATTLEFPIKENTFSFGLIGDTHLGSLYERLDALTSFYELCGEMKIDTVLHTGDVIDGHGIYKGQTFEQHKVGWDAQYNHFKNKYPRIDGITTFFVAGNHDQSFTKSVGINVGQHFQEARDDFRFIDNDSGIINFKTDSGRDFMVNLQHPGGGSSYAISYKLQKIIESLEGGTKPNLLGVGHFHKAEMLPTYRNVCGIQTGTFCAQTPFMVRQALSAHVGGWIINFTVGSKGSNIVNARFVAYY